MRIISKFRDYYDSVQGMGADPKLVYVRERYQLEEEKLQKTRPWNRSIKYREITKVLSKITAILEMMPSHHNIDKGVIGFCGLAYPVLMYEGKGFYSVDKLYEYLRERIRERDDDYGHKRSMAEELCNKERPKYDWLYTRNLNMGTWEAFQERYDPVLGDDIFIHFKAPIVLRTRDKFIVNPRLNTMGFASQVDPYSAYQELSMYISNQLAVQMDPSVDISDELRAESKGFDQWSFRRHKSESKKNRK